MENASVILVETRGTMRIRRKLCSECVSFFSSGLLSLAKGGSGGGFLVWGHLGTYHFRHPVLVRVAVRENASTVRGLFALMPRVASKCTAFSLSLSFSASFGHRLPCLVMRVFQLISATRVMSRISCLKCACDSGGGRAQQQETCGENPCFYGARVKACAQTWFIVFRAAAVVEV